MIQEILEGWSQRCFSRYSTNEYRFLFTSWRCSTRLRRLPPCNFSFNTRNTSLDCSESKTQSFKHPRIFQCGFGNNGMFFTYFVQCFPQTCNRSVVWIFDFFFLARERDYVQGQLKRRNDGNNFFQ